MYFSQIQVSVVYKEMIKVLFSETWTFLHLKMGCKGGLVNYDRIVIFVKLLLNCPDIVSSIAGQPINCGIPTRFHILFTRCSRC